MGQITKRTNKTKVSSRNIINSAYRDAMLNFLQLLLSDNRVFICWSLIIEIRLTNLCTAWPCSLNHSKSSLMWHVKCNIDMLDDDRKTELNESKLSMTINYEECNFYYYYYYYYHYFGYSHSEHFRNVHVLSPFALPLVESIYL